MLHYPIFKVSCRCASAKADVLVCVLKFDADGYDKGNFPKNRLYPIILEIQKATRELTFLWVVTQSFLTFVVGDGPITAR